MKPIYLSLTLILVVLIVLSCQQEANGGKIPNIVILATGGTIAGAAATGTQPGAKGGSGASSR